jgi:diacylglycerol kinase family enzyme
VIIILNRSAGGASADEKLDREIQAALAQHRVQATIWRAGSGEELRALAARAASSDTATVAAGGGDGTISTVAGALVGTSKRLGVLPLGTLNHFAKDVGIPLETRGAVATLATGRETLVDVGEVNGRYFLNNSSIGLYPRIVRHREEQRQRLGRGKWPAFAWALLSALHVCPVLRLRLRIDGGEREVRTPFLFIGNNSYRMDLLRIGSRERLDAGRLSVYYARGAGRWGVVGLAARSVFGRLEQARNFEALLATELQVETRHPSIDVSSDGEVLRLESPLTYRIHPRALRVLVPAGDAEEAREGATLG